MAGLTWSDEEVSHIGEGLLARTLPQPEWTHQAHFAATIHLMTAHPEVDLERDLPGLIRRYNTAVGTPNSDTRGYHETITRFYLLAVPAFLARLPAGLGPGDATTRLARSAFGQIGFPLRYWQRETLLSVAARHSVVAPDRAPFDFATCPLEPDDETGPARWKAPRP